MRKISFLLFLLIGAWNGISQPFTVKGRVLDAITREPLPFVNIVIDDGLHGGTTDIDGRFSLESAAPVQFLRLSYVGYEPLKYPVLTTGEIRISLKRTSIELPGIIISPGTNPAHRIILNAIRNRDRNDPAKIPAFTCTSYDKLFITIGTDSIRIPDTLPADTSLARPLRFTEKSHLFMMESVAERSYLAPGRNHEKVTATRISGLKDPLFVFLISQLQSTSFYGNLIRISDKNYVNPVSPGTFDKYLFILEDTLLQASGDTVFVISFRPWQRTNFDGLKGVLSIHTNGWAIRDVMAEPARDEGGITLKIRQMYELVDNRQWFPVQLETEIRMNNIGISNNQVELNSGKARGLNPTGTGKSYIRNINLNPDLSKKDFGDVEIEVVPDASARDEQYWQYVRIDSLSQLEKNTYHLIDSISRAVNLERQVKIIEALADGVFPAGRMEIELNRFLQYNSYEGLAAGLGLRTSDRISSLVRAGGYFRFGLGDSEWKYGGFLRINLNRYADAWLSVGYLNEVLEPGRQDFFDDHPGFLKPENFRELFVNRMDHNEIRSFSLNFRMPGYLRFFTGLKSTSWEASGPYRFVMPFEQLSLSYNTADFTEVMAGFRYAFREKLVQNVRERKPLPTVYPVIRLQYTRGIRDFLSGDHEYNKVDFKVEKTFYSRFAGRTTVRILAGLTDKNVPYNRLYNAPASFRPFTLYAPYSFAAMRMNEFFSTRFAALFLVHDFGKLLGRSGKFEPEISFVTNMLAGKAIPKKNHTGYDIRGPEKGYFESGILVNNLLNLKFYSVGLGLVYRYGAYAFSDMFSNMAGKITITFPY